MPRRRDLKNLPAHVYRELYHFCMQYPTWKEMLRGCYDLKSPKLSDTPRGGCTTSPVETAAFKADTLRERIALVEDTVKEVAKPEAQAALLLNVTQDVSFVNLRTRHDLYISEHEFKQLRRKFFYQMAVKKGRVKDET